MSQFVNLHSHTVYSMLDGFGGIEDYIKRAKELGMPALAITDHGNVHGWMPFYEAAVEHGIKPLLGIEMYQARKTRFDTDEEERAGRATDELSQRGPHHLTVIARNRTGYHNLIRLSSQAFLTGMYVKPRCDLDLISEYSDGLIVLSGCLSGQVASALLRDDFDAAVKAAGTMQDIVGKDNYFIEIMNHGIDEELVVLPGLRRVAKSIGAPAVPTCDSHYVRLEDSSKHDIYIAVATGSRLSDEDRFQFPPDEFYLKSEQDMLSRFSPEEVRNSLLVAERVEDYGLKFDNYYFPDYPDLPANTTAEDYLEEKTWEGIRWRYGDNFSDEVRARTEHELRVIKSMGFSTYFLVVSDIVNYAKNNGIRTGPGRGCLTGDVPVALTDGTFKLIRDVEVGDEVYSHTGLKRAVLNTFEYDVEEDLYTIRSYFDDSQNPVTLTGDHKIYVEKGRGTDLPLGIPEWLPAFEVEPGDWVVVPKLEREIKPPPVFDLAGFVGEPSSYWTTIVEDDTIIEEPSVGDDQRVEIPRYITVDFDFCKLIGMFATYGWLASSSSTVGLVDDSNLAPLIFKRVFGVDMISDGNQHEFSSRLIWNLFRHLLPNYDFTPETRSLPDFVITLSDELLGAISDGLWWGSEDSHSYISLSKTLIEQVRMLLWHLGIPNGMNIDEHTGNYKIVVEGENTSGGHSRKVGDDLYLRVRSVEHELQSTKVYDIEVEEDHSFLTSSFAVHNSAAGSIVSFAMNITNLDPLRFGLMFERFLVEGRMAMPDIDIDLDDTLRHKVVDYVREKYGDENVAQILTFQALKSRNAIKDAARVLGYEYELSNKVASLVPDPKLGVIPTIDESLETREYKKAYETDPDIRAITNNAKALEGLIRQTSIHAAGVVVTKTPVIDYVPLMRLRREKEWGPITTQWDKDWVEKNGLLKIDLLGLRNLGVIDNCLSTIKERRGIDIDIDNIDFNDPLVYETLKQGNSIGMFQIESGGLQQMMMELQPDTIDDIMALIALYRPGPMGSGIDKMYIARKHGRTTQSRHPILDDLLADTYGLMIYQEGVLKVAREVAGFDPIEADSLRKTLGKKEMDKISQYRDKFVEGCQSIAGMRHSEANALFDDVAYFAGYGFNKSHSASYAIICYQTAWLKVHYPTEYMAALLTSTSKKKSRAAIYLNECRRLGINVIPPSINHSAIDFTVQDDKTILFGLNAIEGVGISVLDSIVSSRSEPYANIYDFMRRCDNDLLKKTTFEHLAGSGALDELMEAQPHRELSRSEKARLLDSEKRELGLYISEHPLTGVWHHLEQETTTTVAKLDDTPGDTWVRLAGIFTNITKKITRRGQEMYITTFEDMTGEVQVIVFPGVVQSFQDVSVGEIGIIEGRVAKEGSGDYLISKVIFNSISSPELPEFATDIPLILRYDSQPSYDHLVSIRKVIDFHPGNTPVFVEYNDEGMLYSLEYDMMVDKEAVGQITKLREDYVI